MDKGHCKLDPHGDVAFTCAGCVSAELYRAFRVAEKVQKVPAEHLVVVGIHEEDQVAHRGAFFDELDAVATGELAVREVWIVHPVALCVFVGSSVLGE